MSAVSSGTETVEDRYQVAGGSCLDCSGDVSAALRRVPGVVGVEVLTTANVVVVRHTGAVAVDDVRAAAGTAGLALLPAGGAVQERGAHWWQQGQTRATAAAGLLFLAGVIVKLGGADTAGSVLFLLSVLVGVVYPLRSAWRALRSPNRLTISTLLVFAAVGALALGLLEEAALLLVVFTLGEMLEQYATDRARRSISGLLELVPPTAHRLQAGDTTEDVPVEQLSVDDVVLVRPGERLPTDGTVLLGRSAVDQSPVTGESVPVDVGTGSEVFGGTVNGNGALRVQVTHAWSDTLLARVVRQVQDAQASRGQAQRFADRFGRIYTPLMFLLALIVAIVPPLLGADLHEWVYRSLVVLVVSCSCALVLSVPVAVVAAVSRAARDGVLIKGGVHLESLAAIRVLAVDKTGTLTRGRPELTVIVPAEGITRDEVLAVAAAVEAGSEHPLAAAIVTAARAEGLALPAVADTRADPGTGVHGTVAGASVFVGRVGSLPEGLSARLMELEQAGHTVVSLTRGDAVLGLLAVADELRPEAPGVLAELRALGTEQIVMLTGDNERTAAAIAAQAGVTSWRAGLLPEDKTAAVRELATSGPVAMIGDGINDAPALATARVGIAMGAAGTAVALETADIALMADDLSRLPGAVALAQRAVRNLQQNIALSLLSIAALIIAALAGQLKLASGLLLNEGSAVLIILNGLRLLRSRTTPPPSDNADNQDRAGIPVADNHPTANRS